MRVEVYYNLHKHVFSVRHKGRVIAHTNAIQIKNAEYVVRKSGRQRVLKEGRKNVHAFVRGDMLEHEGGAFDMSFSVLGDRVTYNPYKFKSFVYKDSEKPIHRSEWALLAKSDDSPPKIFSYK
jgi:hypothetical protein